jgi:hypothetical protein
VRVKVCKCETLVGKIGLWDWKTSSGIRAGYSAQTASYALSENIGQYLPMGREIEYTAILRLGTAHEITKAYEMRAFDGNEM